MEVDQLSFMSRVDGSSLTVSEERPEHTSWENNHFSLYTKVEIVSNLFAELGHDCCFLGSHAFDLCM